MPSCCCIRLNYQPELAYEWLLRIRRTEASAHTQQRTGERLHVWAWRLGAELAPEDAEALFLPRRPGTGAGSKIGLFVARGVAEAQGGRAWAETDGGRLAFHLVLPL